MAEVGTAFVSIVPSARGFGTALSGQVNGQMDSAGRTAGSRFGSSFTKTVGAVFAGAAIGKFFANSIAEASDLNESINAVRVSYGKAGKDILKLSKNSARGFGLSRSEFNGFAVQFSSFSRTVAGADGNVTKTFDSIIGRARDFASVMNLEVGHAAELFQSGLAGETEPLRKFGIDLSAAAVEAFAYANGIAEAGAKLTEGEKVQARYGSLMQQTNKFAGDFKNTNDGLANAQRILSAEWKNSKAAIGGVFLPALATVVTSINDKVVPALRTAGRKVKDFFGGIDLSNLENLDGEKLGTALADALGKAPDRLGSLSSTIAEKLGDILGKVDWLGLGIKVGTQALPFVIGLGTGIISGITDPSVWRQIIDHLPQILLAVLAIAFAPTKLIGPVARLFGKIPLAGKFIESFITGLNAAGGRILGAIGTFLAGLGRAFAAGFGRINFPSLLPKFIESIRLIPTRVGVFLIDLAARFVTGAFNIATRFGTAIRVGFDKVVAFFASLPARFVSALSKASTLLRDVGGRIVDGLLAGLKSAWTRVTAWLADKIAGLSAAAKKLLGIDSPSKVFMAIGRNVSLGMALGMDRGSAAVDAATARLVPSIATGRVHGSVSGPVASDSSRPIRMADGTLFGWVKEIADGSAELVLNKGAFDAGMRAYA